MGGSSPIVTGAASVFIEGRQAARSGDKLSCPGGPTQIESGCASVKIEKSKAARIADTTCHKGALTSGAVTVFIGDGAKTRFTTLDRAQQDAVPFVRG